MSTTQSEKEIPKFSYEPLPDAKGYIRLITILDFDENQPIPVHCKLTTWPLSELPKYHAISYVWGDASHTATILVNGNRMQVTRNCEYTLKQATWYGGDYRRRYYWVDAICINQSNNEEKGHQVPLMGQVYKNAERVLACVGRSNAGSRYLYRKLRRGFGWLGELSNSNFKDSNVMIKDRWGLTPRSTWERLHNEFADFLGRPYFSRVWVFQELCLGRSISVCCGKEHLSIRTLHGLDLTVHWYVYLDGRGGDFREMLEAWGRIGPKRSLILAGALDLKLMAPWKAFLHVQDLECTDLRDRIYGVLSVIDWSDQKPIQPDYKKDRLEIALEVLRIMPRDFRWVDIMKDIWRNLDLFNDPPPRLREALQQRRRLDFPTQLSNPNPSCFIIPNCRGWRLTCEDGKWKFDGNERYIPISVQQQPAFVGNKWSWQRTVAILLPPVTLPGDWCIKIPMNVWMPLIARPRADGHFDIVGFAFARHSYSSWQGGTAFEIHLDDKDAMVIVSIYGRPKRFKPFDGPLDDEITECLNTRVCGHPGSSYAVVCDGQP